MRLPKKTVLCVGCAVVCALAATLGQVAQAEPMWTTYHHDAERSGNDPDGSHPIEPAFAWETIDLGAPIWSQPLVLGERVYVATVGDEVYALEASTGKVVWETSLGTPVPADELPCGDVKPTVGVVGTPAIDPSSQTIYLVADTWDEGTKQAHHVLKGLSLADGKEVLSTNVDPPGADSKAILQRTALNLDAGNAIFGYGGNNGDCSDYVGAVVAAPLTGSAPRFWQYKPAPPSSSGGAVWAPAGPTVDTMGNVYATTGNPDPPPGQTASTFDYSDSVVTLDPALDFVEDPYAQPPSVRGWFEPPNWEEESNNDLDLSSAAAELLPGGLLFQAGKDGVGYLVDEATMSSGAEAVYHQQVCGGHGSFGGDSFAAGVIYIPCTNGTQALVYDEHTCTFTPLWQGPHDAFGPPIVSAGLIWTIATGAFAGGGTKLYGLDPATGIPRYTETLPSPVEDHFASPSAAGGRLFVSTGSSVSAYVIAQLSAGEPSPEEPSTTARCPVAEKPSEPSPNGPTGGATDGMKDGPTEAIAATRSSTKALPAQPQVVLLHTRLHATSSGRVRMTLRCTSTSKPCRGMTALQAQFTVPPTRERSKRSRTILIGLAQARYGPSRGDFNFTLHLDRKAMAHLHRHKNRLALLVTITATEGPALKVTAVLT